VASGRRAERRLYSQAKHKILLLSFDTIKSIIIIIIIVIIIIIIIIIIVIIIIIIAVVVQINKFNEIWVGSLVDHVQLQLNKNDFLTITERILEG